MNDGILLKPLLCKITSVFFILFYKCVIFFCFYTLKNGKNTGFVQVLYMGTKSVYEKRFLIIDFCNGLCDNLTMANVFLLCNLPWHCERGMSMRIDRRKVYFSRLFVCIAVVMSVIAVLVGGFYERTRIKQNNYNAFIGHASEFQTELSNAENRLNVARTVAMLLTEYDMAKQFAASADDYNSLDFGMLLNLSRKITDSQTAFAYLEYSIYVTSFNGDMAVTSGHTCSLDEMQSELFLSCDEIRTAFAPFADEGVYGKFFVDNAMHSACYVTKCVYADKSSIYIINKFLPVGEVCYSDMGETKVVFVGENPSELADKISGELKSLLRKGNIPADQIMKADFVFSNSDVFYRATEFDRNIVVVGSYTSGVTGASTTHWLLLIAAAVALSVLIAFVIAKLAYNPIDRMVRALNPTDAAYDNEIEFIMNKFEDIKSANSALSSTLDSQKEMVAKKILSDILNGYIWGASIEEYADKYNLTVFGKDSVCIAFECNDTFLNMSDYYSTDDVSKIVNSVFEAIEIEFENRGIKAIGFMIYGKKMLFAARDNGNMRSDVTEITDGIRSKTHINLVSIMGAKAQSFEQLCDSYGELLVALDRKPIMDDKEVYTVGELEEQVTLDWYYPINVESELMEHILNADKEKVMFLLKKLFDSNTGNFGKSPANLKGFNFSMNVTIKRILQKINKSEAEVFDFEPDILTRLIATDSLEDTFNILKNCYGALVDCVEDLRKSKPVKLHEQIFDYINAHICNDISLTEISEHFNVSISFIGKVLKDNYNINFKSYVNDMRMKKAMEILDLNPNTKIKDLSAMVGFNSSTSFIRVFQKSVGVSPKVYVENKENNITEKDGSDDKGTH